MKNKKIHIAALVLALGASLQSRAATIVNISGADTSGSIAYNGVTWNRVRTNTTGPFELLDSSGELSGITYSFSTSGNSFNHNSNGQGDPGAAGSNAPISWTTGANSGATLTSTGDFMPWEVVSSYIANNTTDAIYSITLTSDTQLFYSFTLANSRTSISTGATSYNVGGTYNTTTKSFDGGSTLTLTAGEDQGSGVRFDMGVLSPGGNGFASTWNGSAYELTMQVGKFGTPGGSNAAYLNGLVITAIPEPGTLVLVGISLASLLLIRRRR